LQTQGKKVGQQHKKTAINPLKFKNKFKKENGSVILMANESQE